VKHVGRGCLKPTVYLNSIAHPIPMDGKITGGRQLIGLHAFLIIQVFHSLIWKDVFGTRSGNNGV